MTDLEMTRLAAEAMGFNDVRIETTSSGTRYIKHGPRSIAHPGEFRPLHDDAQCMALVKNMKLCVESPCCSTGLWHITQGNQPSILIDADGREIASSGLDLNRAVVECVAKMQSALTPDNAKADQQ